MARKPLLMCGILSALVYLCYDLAALRWHGYSYTSQTVSELSAYGAPTRPLIVPLELARDLLLIGFGLGVRQAAAGKRALCVAGSLLVAIGAVGLLAPVFAMHTRASEKTITDILHVALAGVQTLLILLAVGFSAVALGTRFRFYSVSTIAIMIAFGASAGADGVRIASNLTTPWVGITERIMLGAYLLWVVVLAVLLLRTEGAAVRPARVTSRIATR